MKTKNKSSYALKSSYHCVGAVLPYFLANNTYNNLTFTVIALFQSCRLKIQIIHREITLYSQAETQNISRYISQQDQSKKRIEVSQSCS